MMLACNCDGFQLITNKSFDALLKVRGQIDYLKVIFFMVTITYFYGWGSGNHKNDQVADLIDHAQRVSSEQLHIVIGISYGSVTLPLLWFYGRLLPNLFWRRTWPCWNDHPKVTKNGARMITLRSPIWPREFKSVLHLCKLLLWLYFEQHLTMARAKF